MNTRLTLRPVATCALLTAMAISMFWAHTDLPAGAAEADLLASNTFSGNSAARPAPAASRANVRLDLSELAPQTIPQPELVASGNGSITESSINAVSVAGERITARTETRTVVDPFERIENQDPNRFADLPPLVVQAGRDGQLTRVYRYTGESESGAPVLEIVASARQDEIVNIGTRERPAFVAPAFYGDPITGGIPESVWVALAQCESGGRPSVISAGGRFHGLYQFSVATWRSVGGEGLPSQASPEEQRYRAVRLQARSGWGQWPSCSRRIGVR